MPAVRLEALGRYDCLYISPHRDDAALACAGRMLSERGRNLSVLVVALFEDAGGGRRSGGEAVHERLEADCLEAGIPHARRRDPSDGSYRSLAFRRLPEDDRALFEAARRLADLAPRTRARHVYAPLGVGGHIDHRLAHEAAFRALGAEAGRNLFFYEERPEAFVPGAVRVRLGLLGARLPPGASGAAERAGLLRYLLRLYLAPALRGDLAGWSDRFRTAAPAIGQWRLTRGWNPQRAFGPRLQPVIHVAAPESVTAIAEMAGALLPGRSRARTAERFRSLASAYTAKLGGGSHAERYWLLLPSLDGAEEAALPPAGGQA